MRRLAQELHVAPGALYYHVKNKQQLLILLADYILARAPKSMSEEAEPNPEAIRASMIRRVIFCSLCCTRFVSALRWCV